MTVATFVAIPAPRCFDVEEAGFTFALFMKLPLHKLRKGHFLSLRSARGGNLINLQGVSALHEDVER